VPPIAWVSYYAPAIIGWQVYNADSTVYSAAGANLIGVVGMQKSKGNENKRKKASKRRHAKKVAIPLSFDDAVSGLIRVKPEPKKS
jgi:hypothetical protein